MGQGRDINESRERQGRKGRDGRGRRGKQKGIGEGMRQ